MVKLVEGDYMRQLCIEVSGVPSYCMNIEECVNIKAEVDGKPWYYDIKDSEYQSRAIDSERKFIKCMACQFFLSGEVLYKRNHDTTLLWCVDAPEASHLMEEMYGGLLGAHSIGSLLAQKITKAGYYLLTMECDYIKHVRTCHHCQAYQDRKNASP